jgi:hypothetical protein
MQIPMSIADRNPAVTLGRPLVRTLAPRVMCRSRHRRMGKSMSHPRGIVVAVIQMLGIAGTQFETGRRRDNVFRARRRIF